MKLLVDIGNTSAKAALVRNGVIARRERFPSASPEIIGRFVGRQRLEGAIVSSVGDDPAPLLSWLESRTSLVHYLSCSSRYPFAIDYETPETLGTDRLAAAAGAFFHHPGSDLLVIDAGSALTVDQVYGGAFRGGSISPGVTMRFKALHEHTGRLPLVTKRSGFTFPGKTTEDAIAGGVIMGLAYEIIEYIRTFEEKHHNSVTVITGGDGDIITTLTGGKALFYPDLITEGLIYLLETNV
ncbi:MAG: type III pantothenate kinase [Bacteroidales bacterium]|nr:type III pantothenate kinase [Bacteroidales bacterium]